MTPSDLSRLRSTFSTSPLRTDTDRPDAFGDLGRRRRWRRASRAKRQRVVDELLELLARVGEAARAASVDAGMRQWERWWRGGRREAGARLS